jgi:formate/nitrite transporter FocA (FNT family)
MTQKKVIVMKIVEHLSAIAIITIIMAIFYLVVIHLTGEPGQFGTNERSFNEIESRVSTLSKTVFAGWMLCISVVLINWLVTFYDHKRNLQAHDIK